MWNIRSPWESSTRFLYHDQVESPRIEFPPLPCQQSRKVTKIGYGDLFTKKVWLRLRNIVRDVTIEHSDGGWRITLGLTFGPCETEKVCHWLPPRTGPSGSYKKWDETRRVVQRGSPGRYRKSLLTRIVKDGVVDSGRGERSVEKNLSKLIMKGMKYRVN